MGQYLFLCHSEGSTPVRRTYLKIISNGMQIELAHVYRMLIIMLSCLWALLESRFLMIFPISSAQDRRF